VLNPKLEEVTIPFACSVDGALDTFSVKSSITWLSFKLKIADILLIEPTDLNLAYKFTTDARTQAPNRLKTLSNFIEMIQEARQGLEASKRAKPTAKRAKAFKVEVIDLDAGKRKEKRKKAGGKAAKGKKKVRTHNDLSVAVVDAFSRSETC